MSCETTRSVIVGVAGLVGAAGVALAAVAAHRVADPTLVTAANFLIFHATAAMAFIAVSRGFHRSCLMLVAAGLALAGVMLFSGSIASTVFRGVPLFPMSAPIGGSTLIAAWALSGLAGFLELFGKRGG